MKISSYIAKSLKYSINYVVHSQSVYLSAFLFLCVFTLKGQYFNLRIDFMGYNQGENGYSLEKMEDANYLIFLGAFTEEGDQIVMGRAIVSPEASVLDYQSTGFGNSNLFTGYSNTSAHLFDGGYISAGSRSYFSDIAELVTLCQYYANGELDWIRFYGDSINQTLGRAAAQHANKNLAAVGGKSTGILGDTQGFLLITDSLGNKLEFREYGGEAFDHLFSLFPTIDGGYILGGYTQSYGTVGKWDHYIVKTDSLGNEEWMQVLGSEFDDCPAKVIQTADSNYVFCGCWTHYNIGTFNNYGKLFMAKLDQNGDVMWEKEYLEEPELYANLRKVEELPNGDLLSAGFGDNAQEAYLLRTDAEGNQLWLRYITHPSLSEPRTQLIYDVIADDEGGFVGTGWMFSPSTDSIPGQDLWVFRTDSMGCLVPGCHLVDNVEVHEEEVLVSLYPNPVEDLLSVHVKAGAMPHGAQLQVFDLQGRQQYTTALNPGAATYIVPMVHLPVGMYVLRCVTEDEVVWRGKVLKE